MTFALFSSCDKEEKIPAYLYIEDISLDVKSDRSQGSDAHDIVDAWVYVNNQLVGVFELPATIPVLEEGVQKVTIVGGIKKNGLSNDRVVYPFYTSYDIEMELIPSHTDTLIPVIEYHNATQFVWLDDFEDQTISLEKSGSLSTVDTLILSNDPQHVYGYNGSSEMYSIQGVLDTGFQIFEFSSAQLFDLPRGGDDVYLEFNFKSDVELIAGIYPINSTNVVGVPIVNYFPSSDWKKAYVSLTADINTAEFQGIDFRIFFGAVKSNEDSIANVYLDNIKLIHF